MAVARAWSCLPGDLDQIDGRTYTAMLLQLADEAEARRNRKG